MGDDSLDRGRERPDPELVLLGHRILGMTHFYSGRPVAAREHLETGLSLGGSRRSASYELDESVVHCRSLLGLVLWILGYPDQALERCNEAVSIARRINHPMSLGCAHHHRGMVLFFRHDVDATRREAEALLKIAADYGLPQWSAWGGLLQGWVRSLDQPMVAVPQLCQALASWRATGARSMVPTYLAVLAATFDRAGDAKMGLSTIAEALAVIDEHGEHLNEAELLRLKGKLLVAHQPAAAEQSFRRALDVARDQQGLSWELWAATSLARLLADRGQTREARELLKDDCGRFTEGFETPDLRGAQALMETIAAPLRAVPS